MALKGQLRAAFRLLEKAAEGALDSRVGEVIKTGLIVRKGLTDAVIERHEVTRTQQTAPMSNGAALALIKSAGAPG